MRSKITLLSLSICLVAVAVIVGPLVTASPVEQISTQNTSNAVPQQTNLPSLESEFIGDILPVGYFAKFDGIDGESMDTDHPDWINIASFEWGAEQPDRGASASSRTNGGALVEDFVITFLYEKSAPKLAERCLSGQSIPKLQVELTRMYGEYQKTYLRYELSNVVVKSYHVMGYAESATYPMVSVAVSFERIRGTYTEYDESGQKIGNVEFLYDAEKGVLR